MAGSRLPQNPQPTPSRVQVRQPSAVRPPVAPVVRPPAAYHGPQPQSLPTHTVPPLPAVRPPVSYPVSQQPMVPPSYGQSPHFRAPTAQPSATQFRAPTAQPSATQLRSTPSTVRPQVRPAPSTSKVASRSPNPAVSSAASQAVTGQNADEFDFSFNQFIENTFSQYQRLRGNLAAAHDKKMPVCELQIREFREYQTSVGQQLSKFQTVLDNQMIKLPKAKEYKKTLFKSQTQFMKLHLDPKFLGRIKTHPEQPQASGKPKPRPAPRVTPTKVESKTASPARPGPTSKGYTGPAVRPATQNPAQPARAPMSLSAFESNLHSAPSTVTTTLRAPMSLDAFEQHLPSAAPGATPGFGAAPGAAIPNSSMNAGIIPGITPDPSSGMSAGMAGMSAGMAGMTLGNGVASSPVTTESPTGQEPQASETSGFDFINSGEEVPEQPAVVMHMDGQAPAEGDDNKEDGLDGQEPDPDYQDEDEELLVLEPCSLSPTQFQAIWTDAGCYNVSINLKFESPLADATPLEQALTAAPLSAQLLASGNVNGRIKIYAYGRNARAEAFFLFEILEEVATGVVTITLRSEPQNSPECNSAFIGLIGRALLPFNPEPI